MQIEAGRYFLHGQHPKFAPSWELECITKIEAIPGVGVGHGDQCQFGAVSPHGPTAGRPVKKATGFMSNSSEVLRSLSPRCHGRGGACTRAAGGMHATCGGGISKGMAKYPRELCRAVLKGIAAQLRVDGRLQSGCYGVQVACDDVHVEEHLYGPEQGYSGSFKDDLTGQVLKDEFVRAARAVELAFFTSKGV